MLLTLAWMLPLICAGPMRPFAPHPRPWSPPPKGLQLAKFPAHELAGMDLYLGLLHRMVKVAVGVAAGIPVAAAMLKEAKEEAKARKQLS